MNVRANALLAALLFTACQRQEDAAVAPPPLPVAPVQAPVEAPTAPPSPAPAEVKAREPEAPRASKSENTKPKSDDAKPKADSERPKGWGAAYVPPPAAAAPAPVVVAPKPAPAPVPTPAPPPAPAKPKTRVSIPSTEHVRVEIPSGLQADLDADPRMQPWVEKVVAIADSCHAKARGNVGAIEAQVTMRENARPDVDVRSVPAQLGSLVACATGSLLRTKMPLFTGREGTRYSVRVVFQ
ncbi:MAG: hypothetical protein ABW352_06835 [Polyangiales bacterium]